MSSMAAAPGAKRDRPSRQRAELILGQLDKLPALPAVVVRLLAVTASDESSARDVVMLIESDSALTAAILRMAKRADLGVRGEVTTVDRAVPLLGFTAVRNAVLALRIFEVLSTGDSAGTKDTSARTELWKHSLAVACASQMLAEYGKNAPMAGEAFVCGLLHDIGKLALDACLPKSYARVLDTVERSRTCICDVELDLLGLDHTAAGKRLLQRWELPQSIVECAWLHHQTPDALPSAATAPDLIRLVHLADNLVRRQKIGLSGYQHVDDLSALAGEIGVDDGAIDDVAKRLPDRMEALCEFVGLNDLDSRHLYVESLAKANAELGRTNENLAETNARLALRSAAFDALASFSEALAERDRIEDVCRAAAHSLREMIGVDTAIVFARVGSSECIRVGIASASTTQAETDILDPRDPENTALRTALSVEGAAPTIVPAAEPYQALWRRCAAAPCEQPLWALALPAGGRVIGACLFAGDAQVVGRWRSAPEECVAIATAMGLAAATAITRNDAERMADELLDVNRRFRAAQVELLRTRSLSMIGEMAAGAAHELNNPLSVISGRAQMRLAKSEDPDLSRAMQIIVEQAHSASQIVTDLMDFAKPPTPKPATLVIADLLESLLQHWQTGSSLGTDHVSVTCADPSVAAQADEQQLRAVLDAVMANAVEAMKPESARLQINSPSRASDETVRIVIEDNGCGMTPDVLEHAVDPFYSYRPAGRGRGLGLSRAHRLAEANGGKLWLESTPGVGTSVTIELPARTPSD